MRSLSFCRGRSCGSFLSRLHHAAASSGTGTPSLAGHTALVTGSTSGIGLGVAEVLASHGANVVINGFGDAAPALKSVGEAASRAGCGGKVAFMAADLTSEKEVDELAKQALTTFGVVDIVVNNAGACRMWM